MNSRQIPQNDVSGLLLLNKKSGLTSFEALGAVKRALSTRKVGHTGTLDKFAEGLLLVLTGRALKLSPWFTHCDKHYEAVVRFGAETDTLDPEGAVIAEAEIPSREAVEKALSDFSGVILQAPPAYSAIHINGKRASALARSGEPPPEMKKREVTIYALTLRSWEPPFALFHVHCSSGTYIRSLARDIALAAGSRAYLTGLKRTKVAGFALSQAVRLDENSAGESSVSGDNGLAAALTPINKAVFSALGLPLFEIDAHSVQKIIQGKPLSNMINDDIKYSSASSADLRALCGLSSAVVPAGIFCGDDFIAMIEKHGETWKYGYVYAHN
ncbi:MAG: tRNA pseudouridine(55) synthase TruB [Treponema sp.]|jgi:tRNA pseudouridine55 synthase|nr:tRNA pseudouridine(55) synthase TruB [Treponema sp.]